MAIIKKNYTRGYGVFENFLSHQRAKIANRLIGAKICRDRILDIGCGYHPYFLINTNFKFKYGLDKLISKNDTKKLDSINLLNYDIERKDNLPFEDNYFNAVTMLATFEHIEPKRLLPIMKEIKRVLKKNGIFIITTPARWSEKLLIFLSKLRLVSNAEIAEHKNCYNIKKITSILIKSGFKNNKIKSGYFEARMNIWIKIIK